MLDHHPSHLLLHLQLKLDQQVSGGKENLQRNSWVLHDHGTTLHRLVLLQQCDDDLQVHKYWGPAIREVSQADVDSPDQHVHIFCCLCSCIYHTELPSQR